jgi:hypothetical protein
MACGAFRKSHPRLSKDNPRDAIPVAASGAGHLPIENGRWVLRQRKSGGQCLPQAVATFFLGVNMLFVSGLSRLDYSISAFALVNGFYGFLRNDNNAASGDVSMNTLSERIAERLKGSAPYSNRAIVLALRVEIQKALDDGWSILAMHQLLHEEGALSFSYQAFRRHVNRIFLCKPNIKAPHSPKRPASNTLATAKPSVEFSFNAPQKEEP